MRTPHGCRPREDAGLVLGGALRPPGHGDRIDCGWFRRTGAMRIGPIQRVHHRVSSSSIEPRRKTNPNPIGLSARLRSEFVSVSRRSLHESPSYIRNWTFSPRMTEAVSLVATGASWLDHCGRCPGRQVPLKLSHIDNHLIRIRHADRISSSGQSTAFTRCRIPRGGGFGCPRHPTPLMPDQKVRLGCRHCRHPGCS